MQIAAKIGAWDEKSLPYLRRVSWLQSDGSAFIDTGIKLNNRHICVCRFRIISREKGGVFGSRRSASSMAFYTNINSSFQVTLNQPGINVTYNENPVNVGQSWEVTVRNGISSAKRDGVQLRTADLSSAEFETPAGAHLFTVGGDSSPDGINAGIGISSFSVYDVDKLVLDVYPVLDQDGIPAMYDDVMGKFFYNKGNGQFTWGELDTYNLNDIIR